MQTAKTKLQNFEKEAQQQKAQATRAQEAHAQEVARLQQLLKGRTDELAAVKQELETSLQAAAAKEAAALEEERGVRGLPPTEADLAQLESDIQRERADKSRLEVQIGALQDAHRLLETSAQETATLQEKFDHHVAESEQRYAALMAAAEQEKTRASNALRQLEQELADAQTALEAVQKQVGERAEDFASLLRRAEEDAQAEAVTVDRDSLARRFAEHEQEGIALRTRIQELTDQLGHLASQLSDAQGRAEELSGLYAAATERLEDLECASEAHAGELELARQVLRKTEEDHVKTLQGAVAAKQQFEAARHAQTERAQRNAQLEDDVAALTLRLKKQRAEMDEVVATFSAEVRHVTSERDAHEAAAAAEKRNAAEAQHALDILRQQTAMLTAEFEQLLNATRRDLEEKEAQHAALQLQCRSLEARVEALQGEADVDTLRRERSVALRTQFELQEQLTAAEDTAKRLADALGAVEQELSRTRMDLSTALRMQDELRRHIDVLEGDLRLADHKARTAAAAAPAADLVEKLVASEEAIQTAHREMQRMTEAYQHLEDEATDLRMRMQRAEDTCLNYRRKITELTSENADLNLRLQQMPQPTEPLLLEKLASQHALIAHMEGQLKTLTAACTAMKTTLDRRAEPEPPKWKVEAQRIKQAYHDAQLLFMSERDRLQQTNMQLQQRIASLTSVLGTLSDKLRELRGVASPKPCCDGLLASCFTPRGGNTTQQTLTETADSTSALPPANPPVSAIPPPLSARCAKANPTQRVMYGTTAPSPLPQTPCGSSWFLRAGNIFSRRCASKATAAGDTPMTPFPPRQRATLGAFPVHTLL